MYPLIYIERCRMQKFAPNACYSQFIWIDFAPQRSFTSRPMPEGHSWAPVDYELGIRLHRATDHVPVRPQ